MNCQSPEACAEDSAMGLNPLSTKGSSASSVGNPAALDLVHDEMQVTAGSHDDGLHQLGPRRVPGGLLGHELAVDVGNGESETDALPQAGRLAQELLDLRVGSFGTGSGRDRRLRIARNVHERFRRARALARENKRAKRGSGKAGWGSAA